MQGAFASRFNVPAAVGDGARRIRSGRRGNLPAAALTARLAFDWAQLRPGDRVLIHAASGGVGGMAAIQLARHHGATVFATRAPKRATLRRMGVEYVYDSPHNGFRRPDPRGHRRRGCRRRAQQPDQRGASSRRRCGRPPRAARFAEIAKRDIWTAEQMAAVRPDINYEIVALDDDDDRSRPHQDVDGRTVRGMARGEWTPVPAEVYPLTEARTAFRRMQQARHIGKIVVQMPTPLSPRPDRSYLVTGGLARWVCTRRRTWPSWAPATSCDQPSRPGRRGRAGHRRHHRSVPLPGASSSPPTSAMSPRPPRCWTASAPSCRRWPASRTSPACSTTPCRSRRRNGSGPLCGPRHSARITCTG